MSHLIRAGALQGYIELMASLAIDPAPLLQGHGMSASELEDSENQVDLKSAIQLLEASAQAANCNDLGLRLAQVQDLRMLGPLSIIAQNASTLAEALFYCSRYMHAHSPGLIFQVHEACAQTAGLCELVIGFQGDVGACERQGIDLCLGDMHRFIRVMVGDAYRLEAVLLPHMPLASRAHYERYFGARVRVDQAYAALHVQPQLLEHRMTNGNALARMMAQDYLERHFGAGEAQWSTRVRYCLNRALGTPYASKSEVARLLSLHPRTLQRQLQREGTSFDQIKDDVRRAAAQRFLTSSNMPLSHVATMVWLSEQSALTRACQRWFGMTPSAVRNHPSKLTSAQPG